MKKLIQKFKNLSQKSLVRHSLWELLAKAINLGCQAVYFTVIVRVLGTENYGSFVAIASLAVLIFPFANLGSGDVLIQQVSREKKVFPTYWGNTLAIVFGSSLFLTAIAYFGAAIVFGHEIDVRAIWAILLADLTGISVFTVSAKAFMSHSLLKNSSILQIVSTATKLAAAILLATYFPQPNLWHWAYLYLLSALVTAAIGIMWVTKTLGKPQLESQNIRKMVNRGIYFSIGESANNINSHIDKTMLASMASLEATGIYGAAYRLIEVGSVPLYAVLSASYPRFFQQGIKGIRSCLILVRQLLPFVAVYSVFALIGFLVFAPWITYILGDEYQNAIATIRWLAPIPIIGALQQLLADSLTGAGFQRIRSGVQITTAFANLGLNLWLIPLYSWRGAVWATLGSDGFRLLCLAAIVSWFSYQEKSRV